MAGRTVQPEALEFQIRVGAKFGPPHEGGRRGTIALEGMAPPEFGPWLEKMTAHPLAERFGGVWVYLGGQLVSARPSGAASDDPDEVRARQALLDVDAMEGDAAARRQLLERLDVRVLAVRERVEVETARLTALMKEQADLEVRLATERQRYATEVERLDQELAQARASTRAVKETLMAEQLAFASNMAALQEQVGGAFSQQLQRTIADAQAAQVVEASIGKDAVGRKVEAVENATKVIELLQGVEAAGLHSLLPGGEKAPSKSDRLIEGAASWFFAQGGADKCAEGLSNLINRWAQKPPAG